MWKFPHYEVGQPIPWDKLEAEFDWFRDMKGVEQDAEWHAEGDVFVHTKMVAEALIAHPEFDSFTEQQKHILFATAMLHDVEKRSTTEEEEIDGRMRITSRNHAKKGEKTARVILYKDIPTPFEIREHICKLVRHHGLPIWNMDKDNPAKDAIGVSLKLNTKMLAVFAEADIYGRICNDADDMLTRVEIFKDICEENECWGQAREFASDLGKRYYFQKEEAHPDYEPYDEKNFTAIVMCALPGSGKDTYIRRFLNDMPMISLDEIRRERKIKRGDSKAEGHMYQDVKEMCKVHMRARRDFVFNATNITKDMRGKVIKEFEEYGAKVQIVYVEVPYKTLLSQNHNRDHKVPEKALEDMIWSLDVPDQTECYGINYFINS